MKTPRIVAVVAGATALLTVAALAGCSSQPSAATSAKPSAAASSTAALVAAAQKEGTFTVYSGSAQQNVNTLIQDFEQQYPGIRGQDVFLSTAAGDARIQSEYKTHDTFDISINDWGSDTVDLAKQGIFASYKSPNASLYPAQFQGTDDRWINMWAGTQLIAYNTTQMTASQAPKTWEDLTKSQYKGKVGVSTPLIKGGAYWWYYNMNSWYGSGFIKKFAANDPVIESAPSGVGSALAAGQIPVGVVTLAAYQNAVRSGAPVKAVYPTDGVFLQTLYMGIASNAPHPNAARLFYDWVISKQGASVAADLFGYYSTLDNGPAPIGAPALDKLKVRKTDSADFIAKEDSITATAASALGVG